MAKDCPGCGLLNPHDAARCDCGYHFATRRRERSYLPPKEAAKLNRKVKFAISGVTAFVIVALIIRTLVKLYNQGWNP